MDSSTNGAAAPASALTVPTHPPVKATLTRYRNAQPLVILDGGPFNGFEARPGELRRLGEQLIAIAEMATRLPSGGKSWRPTIVWVESGPEEIADERASSAGGQA